MTPALSRHLSDHPIHLKEEDEKLADIIQNNKAERQKAIEALVLNNLKLATKIIHQEYSYFKDKEDLFAEAVIALYQAATRYKSGYNTRFSTYAAPSIRSRIQRFIGKHSYQVIPSQRARAYLSLVRRFIDLYVQEYGTEPTAAQISEILGIDEESVEEMTKYQFQYTSLDAPSTYNDDTHQSTLADTLPDLTTPHPSTSADTIEQNSWIFQGMEALNEREKQIIIERFGINGNEPKTLERIGQNYNVSRERIRQVEGIALRKLKKRLTLIAEQHKKTLTTY